MAKHLRPGKHVQGLTRCSQVKGPDRHRRSRRRISVVKGAAAGDRPCQSLFLFEACPSTCSGEGCLVESGHGFPALPLDTNRLGH
jgi:hypothetical protein